MKKLLLPCLITVFLLALWGCKVTSPLESSVTTTPTIHSEFSTAITSTTAQPTTESTTAPKPRERHEYNKHNPDKNLFLQFLHGEIPFVTLGSYGGVHYFSDTNEIRDENEQRFYIIDMDGDGKPELGCIYPELTMMSIIRYNEEKDCFEEWLSGRHQQIPLGNGQMHEYKYFATATAYSYDLYDKNANLIKSVSYITGERYPYDTTYYQIDFVDVTEEEWKAESAFLFELIENAPKPMSYKELYTP